MTARLSGRTAVLIGAAVGIGRGIAQRLVEDGAQLVVGDVNETEGRALMKGLGLDQGQFLKVDVSSAEDCKALVDLAVSRFGMVDILVQNAGIYPVALIDEATVEHWDHVMAVNLRGAFVSTKACVPVMRANGWGRVVFTSSITGPRVVSHGLSAYAATKAGINGFIKVAALELATAGITVNGVEPGNILTEGLQAGRSAQFIQSMERSIPMGRLGTPRDIANAVCFLASDDAAYITGTTIIVDGGQTLPENKDFIDPSTWS
jgi:3-oxoacyl-[acyl-carrier protein] reductase